MSARFVTAALILCTFSACGRRDEQTNEGALERKDLVAVHGDAGEAWWRLKRDLAGGRFWMAWRYAGVRIGFTGQPVFDSSRNPILVSIFRTPIWCHVELSPAEFAEVQKQRTEVDSFTMTVLGRVESINWYTKHVTIQSLQSYPDGGQ